MAVYKIRENANTQVKKALFGDNTEKIKIWAILTPENPHGELPEKPEYTEKQNAVYAREENNRLLKDFKAVLRKLGIRNYTKISGSYGNKERSFIIYNITLNEAKYLASMYEQQSFFFGTNSVPATITYYLTDDCENYDAIETKKGVKTLNDAKDFFSRHGDFQFTIDMKVFEDARAYNEAIIDESQLDYILQENRTFFSRMIHRQCSVGKILKD